MRECARDQSVLKGLFRGREREKETHFRITNANLPNWNKFRTTNKKISNTSSPFAEQPEKKITTRVTPQKIVMMRSKVL